MQHLKWFLDELMWNENPACIRVFLNNVKPFSNLCLPAFSCTQISLGSGRVRPLHCNCNVWWAPSVTGEIFNGAEPLWGVFLNYNALLQPDKHTAGVFTCAVEQANHHLELTGAFHEPMSAFNPLSRVRSLSLYAASLTHHSPSLTAGQHNTYAWINKTSSNGVWAEGRLTRTEA